MEPSSDDLNMSGLNEIRVHSEGGPGVCVPPVGSGPKNRQKVTGVLANSYLISSIPGYGYGFQELLSVRFF